MPALVAGMEWVMPITCSSAMRRRYAGCAKAHLACPVCRILISGWRRAYAQAGRLEEARAAAAEVLRINPSFTIKSWKPLAVYKDPKDLERYLVGLRKAGLPES
jgi:hypothetical protein